MAKPRNSHGAAGKRGLPGTEVAEFFDHFTHEMKPGWGKIINGHHITADQNRTLRRWRNGGGNANPKAVIRLLWDLGFSQDFFDRWRADKEKT